jgi:HEAT repeat protein
MVASLQKNVFWSAVSGCILLIASTSQAMDASVKDLIEKLKSSEASSRLQAIDELGSKGHQDAEAVAALTALLKDQSAPVRAHAAWSLGRIGAAARPAIDELVALVADADQSVRRQAVAALAAIRPGPKVAIPLFTKLLNDADPAVRTRVLNGIAEAGVDAVPGLIEALKDEKAAYWACVILREIGPAAKAAVPALAAKLSDRSPDVRREAVLALGNMNEGALPAVPQIAETLNDEHARTAATFVLGELGKIPPAAEATIRANAKSNDKFLSTVSLWALARVHPDDVALRRQATEQIVERLTDQDPFVRVAAARALAGLPPAPEITLPILEKALSNANPTTAQHALDALATLGAPAVPRFVEILNRHKNLRLYVVYMLGQIGPAAAPATEALAKLAADENELLATEAVVALGKIGPAAKGAVPALCAALNRADCENAPAIVETLGEIGPAAAAAKPLVLKAIGGKDPSLAVVAAWALTRLEPRSPNVVMRAVPVLLAGLSAPLPETRASAAEALAELGPWARASLPALRKAQHDESQAVRDAAAKAIKAIQ